MPSGHLFPGLDPLLRLLRRRVCQTLHYGKNKFAPLGLINDVWQQAAYNS